MLNILFHIMVKKKVIFSKLTYSITQEILYLALVSCLNNFEGTAEYTFLNPGNEQLSSGDIPLPRLFFLLTGIWFILNLVWCFNWIQHRSVINHSQQLIKECLTF